MMKQSWILPLIICMLTSLIFSCTSENKENLEGECKTDSLSYANDIVPIFRANCYGCHGNGNDGGSGGIDLEDTSTLNHYIENGQLMANITHTSNNPMPPPPAPKLDTCEISQIQHWIAQGAIKN